MTPRERVIKVLLRVLSAPYQYTKKDLCEYFGVSLDQIKKDLYAIRKTGLEVDIKHINQYKIGILPDYNFKELRYLQPLSDADKAQIARALDYLSNSKDKMYLAKKLDRLYDFQQLGLRALRRPALERIDRLVQAKNRKQCVILENYRSSSSGTIRNRLVEPFHIDPEKDTLQAYDIDARDSRHYRLSRIERVSLTSTPWCYEGDHRPKITDVFRIADNDQVFVQLTLDVFAYNALTEEFPLTLTYIDPGSEPNTYDFQCLVNHDYKGLINFIMGNTVHLQIHSPPSLIERVCMEAENILKKF